MLLSYNYIMVINVCIAKLQLHNVDYCVIAKLQLHNVDYCVYC